MILLLSLRRCWGIKKGSIKDMSKRRNVERRQWDRADHILNIEYKLESGDGQHTDVCWHLSTTQDMSAGGLSFLSEYKYKEGDLLRIKVVMSGILDIYEGYATVVHIKEKKNSGLYLLGVKFTDKPGKH